MTAEKPEFPKSDGQFFSFTYDRLLRFGKLTHKWEGYVKGPLAIPVNPKKQIHEDASFHEIAVLKWGRGGKRICIVGRAIQDDNPLLTGAVYSVPDLRHLMTKESTQELIDAISSYPGRDDFLSHPDHVSFRARIDPVRDRVGFVIGTSDPNSVNFYLQDLPRALRDMTYSERMQSGTELADALVNHIFATL